MAVCRLFPLVDDSSQSTHYCGNEANHLSGQRLCLSAVLLQQCCLVYAFSLLRCFIVFDVFTKLTTATRRLLPARGAPLIHTSTFTVLRKMSSSRITLVQYSNIFRVVRCGILNGWDPLWSRNGPDLQDVGGVSIIGLSDSNRAAVKATLCCLVFI